MTQYVPVTDGNGNDWSIYDVATAQTYAQQLETKTDLLSLLNSVVVYYANERARARFSAVLIQAATA